MDLNKELAQLAIRVAFDAPRKRNRHALAASVSWDLVEEIRGTLAVAGVDVEKLLKDRDAQSRELSQLRAARMRGRDDRSKGLGQTDWPLEYGDGSLRDQWLEGWLEHKSREARS